MPEACVHNTDLISIIMPAYNAATVLEDAVRSVLAQTHRDWELIIIDDCSVDGTRDLIENLMLGDSRIRYIRLPQNGGPARARNVGLAAAKSCFIAFLDSDDLWMEQKLERQVAFMRGGGEAFTYTQFRRMTADAKKLGKLRRVPRSLSYRELLKNTAIVTSSVMVDRRLTGDFRIVESHYEDFATWLSLLRRGLCARGIPEDLVRYRVSKGSLSGNKLRGIRWIWGVYRNVEELEVPYALWCFANYSWRAFWKRRTL